MSVIFAGTRRINSTNRPVFTSAGTHHQLFGQYPFGGGQVALGVAEEVGGHQVVAEQHQTAERAVDALRQREPRLQLPQTDVLAGGGGGGGGPSAQQDGTGRGHHAERWHRGVMAGHSKRNGTATWRRCESAEEPLHIENLSDLMKR